MEFILTVILSVLALTGWLSYVRYQRYQFTINNGNARFEAMLKRFENQKEFLDFLQSANGLRVLNMLTSSPTSTKIPIIILACSGIVSFAIGMGALILTLFEDGDLIFATAFTSSLGLGLLAAASVSLKLSRKWGVFEESVLPDKSDGSLSAHSSQEEKLQ